MNEKIRNKHILGVLVLLSLILVQGLFLMSRDSPTYDEPNHITSGYSYLTTGDFRMSLAQPPAARMLMAVPLLFMKPNLPTQNQSWKQADDWTFAREFLFYSGNDADSIVFWARFPILLLSLLLGAFVFVWSKEVFGIRAAYFSLVLYVFSPNLLAHGRLATTEMPLACFAFMSSFYFWKLLKNPGVKNTLLSGLFLGLALSSKYSGIIFVLSFLMLAVVWGWRRQAGITARPSLKALFSRGPFRHLVGCGITVVVVGMVIALLSSGASMKPVLNYAAVQTKVATFGEKQVFMFENQRVGRIAYRLASTVPVPRYVVGMLFNHFHFKRGHLAYLAGEWKLGGWWYYFPVAFLLKVPLPLLVLLCIWLYVKLKSRSCFSSAELVLFCVPVVSLLWSMAFVRLNIGFRHILFILPFFHVLLGSVVSASPKVAPGNAEESAVSSTVPRLSRLKMFFLLALLLWYCFESLLIFPHHLAYFNELAGGPRGGVNWLVDSNLDWGQDLKRLRNYVDTHRIDSLKLLYFGTADPAHYGVKSERLTLQDFRNLEVSQDPGLEQEHSNEKWALSATNYAALLRTAPWLKKIQGREAARIGYSIFVFSPSKLKPVLFPEMTLEARLREKGQ